MSVESALKFELAQQQIQLDEVARKLSNVLHGDVQSQLIAVALSLNMAADGFDRDHDAANARGGCAMLNTSSTASPSMMRHSSMTHFERRPLLTPSGRSHRCGKD